MQHWLVAVVVSLLPLKAQSDPALLQLRVIEGEAVVYPLGARATRGLTVQVTDETGKPVEGATVSFKLPEEGPSGTFNSGGRTEIVTTHADGRASVWGMQWNRTAGSLQVRVTAVKGSARAGTVVAQYLTAALETRQSRDLPPSHIGGSSHKWIWVVLGLAGAAGGAAFATGLGGKNGPAAAAIAAPVTRIGVPVIAIGRP